MNRYTASYQITRTRVIVERAIITREIQATSFGTAGASAEASEPSQEGAEFVTVSDSDDFGPLVLDSISFDGVVEPEPAPVAAAAPADDGSGLTPALYGPSTAPSGGEYFPVQVEPTPDLG